MNIQELPTLKIDLKDNYVVEAICKQLDDLILSFEIYNSYIPIDLSGFNVEFRALKSDKVPLIQDTDIIVSRNIVKIKCNPQVTTTSGIEKCELLIIDKTSKEKKFSFDIEIDVKPSVLEVNRSISTPTCTLIERLEKDLDRVKDLEFNFNQADKLNKEIKNTTTPTANNINNALVKNIDVANTSNKNLIDSVSTANSTKQSVDSSVSQANSSKQALDNSKTNADNTKKEVDESVKVANEKIEFIKKIDPQNIVQDVKTLKEQVLENRLMPIETDSTLTKLKDCTGGFVRNMQLLGKTLQNVNRDCVFSCVVSNQQEESYYNHFIKKGDMILKPSTTYTFVVDVTSGVDYGSLYIGNTGSPENQSYFKNQKGISHPVTGRYIFTLDTKDNFEDKNIILASRDFLAIPKGNGKGEKFECKYMILEGEVKEPPSYFDGIKSVGELEGNKISILCCGKNLLELNEIGKFNSTNGEKQEASEWVRSDFIRIDNSKTYTLSFFITEKGYSTIYTYDSNKKFIGYISDTEENVKSFTLNKNVSYIKVQRKGNLDIKAQLEEGTTSYEKYDFDKTTILLSSPHVGLPNGVADVVDYDKNERIKNVIKYVLNGSVNENWMLMSSDTKTIRFVCKINTIKPQTNINTINVISDILQNKTQLQLGMSDEEGISSHNEFGIQIRVPKEKLETLDISGVRKYLQNNNIPVYCELANPIIERLNIKDTLQTFTDGYIQLDNAITPTTHLEYSTNIPSAIGGLTEKVDHNVDEITNIESTISDLDAEIGEARKDKETLNERLDDDKKEILNIINQLSNPNLLINGNFQVWQRGTQFNCTDKVLYTTDRFVVAGEQHVPLVASQSEEGCLKLIFQEHIPNTSNIRTYFDYQDYLKVFKGKVLTFSCEYMSEYNDNWFDDVRIFGQEIQVNIIKTKKISLGNKWFRKIVTFEITNLKENVSFHIQWFRGNEKDLFGYHLFENFKLELGSVATPFVPRNYAEELALCQRYYQRVRFLGSAIGGSETQPANNISINQSLPIEMRTTPTVQLFANTLYKPSDNTNVDFLITSYNANNKELNNFVSSNFSIYQKEIYSAIFLLDAEIY